MHLNPAIRHPYLVENVFTPEECNAIVQMGLKYDPVHDVPYEKRLKVPQGKRRIIQNESDHQSIIQKIMPHAALLNEQKYKFQIGGIEMPHFCEYNPGESSPWHHDLASDANTNRKLSLLVFLSDPDSFTGGQFHIYPNTERSLQAQGNMMIFPAFFLHQVEAVLTGVRYSLVTWGIGNSFV